MMSVNGKSGSKPDSQGTTTLRTFSRLLIHCRSVKVNDAPIAAEPAKYNGTPSNRLFAVKFKGEHGNVAKYLHPLLDGGDVKRGSAALSHPFEEAVECRKHCISPLNPVIGKWAFRKKHRYVWREEIVETHLIHLFERLQE